MSNFGRGSLENNTSATEVKSGRVTAIKASPEKGKRRYTVREKSGVRKSFTVDIPYSQAGGIERKEDYSFNVYEVEERKSYGGARSSSQMKSYKCDESPEVFTEQRKSQFSNFETGKGNLSGSGRTKF